MTVGRPTSWGVTITARAPPSESRDAGEPAGKRNRRRLQGRRPVVGEDGDRPGPTSCRLSPSDNVVGLVELTVVEPIWKVVLVVDEKRQVATPFTSTGQWAKSVRLLGSVAARAMCGRRRHEQRSAREPAARGTGRHPAPATGERPGREQRRHGHDHRGPQRSPRLSGYGVVTCPSARESTYETPPTRPGIAATGSEVNRAGHDDVTTGSPGR